MPRVSHQTIQVQRLGPDEHEGYEFEPDTGNYRPIRLGEAASVSRRPIGFGDVRRVGLIRKTEVFVAIYALNDQLHVALPPQHFVWPGPYRARRVSRFNRVKRFEITSGARICSAFRYCFADSAHEFPGPEAVDIFFMIAAKTKSTESIRTFLAYWAGAAKSCQD